MWPPFAMSDGGFTLYTSYDFDWEAHNHGLLPNFSYHRSYPMIPDLRHLSLGNIAIEHLEIVTTDLLIVAVDRDGNSYV